MGADDQQSQHPPTDGATSVSSAVDQNTGDQTASHANDNCNSNGNGNGNAEPQSQPQLPPLPPPPPLPPLEPDSNDNGDGGGGDNNDNNNINSNSNNDSNNKNNEHGKANHENNENDNNENANEANNNNVSFPASPEKNDNTKDNTKNNTKNSNNSPPVTRPRHQHRASEPVPAFHLIVGMPDDDDDNNNGSTPSHLLPSLLPLSHRAYRAAKTPASKSLDGEAGINSPKGASIPTEITTVAKTRRPTLVDADGHDLLFHPEDFEVIAHGVAGRLVQRMGILGYMLFFVVPGLYVALFFGLIPLGNPIVGELYSQWVFLFISNVGVMLAIAYLYNAAFLILAEVERPFRTSVIPLLSVILGQIVIMSPILLTAGTTRYQGIIALTTCYLCLYLSMRLVAYADMSDKVDQFFRRFMLLLVLYIPLLSAFVIAYREANSSGSSVAQSALSFTFTFATFIYRRIMLSRLDPYPLDAAQLFSGFWVQNLGDCTTILAFPQVNSPSVFAAVFLSNSIANIGFLIFVSDLWIYRLRPWLKTRVKHVFTCSFPLPPIPEPDESFDPDNRGHDYNTGGYRRRQFRFFFFRLMSQSVAMVMYLSVSPILRYGTNGLYTPLAEATGLAVYQYRNSMIYAACNLGFIAVVGVFGYAYLSKQHDQTFHEIREIHRHDFVHHTMVGMVTAIITHNMIMTIAIILSHYCIFASFHSCKL